MELKPGHIEDGYRYAGGDPSNPASWQEIGPQTINYSQAPNAEAIASAAEEETGNPVAIGLGRLFDTSAMGLKQTAMEGARRLPFTSDDFRERMRQGLAELSQDQAYNTAAYGRYQQRFPLDTAVGETLPLAFMGGTPLAAGLQVGGVEALRYGSPQDRVSRGLVGGAGAGVAGLFGNALKRYINPPLNSMQKQALETAQRIGVNPRLSEVLQSPSVARAEDWAARVPGGAGVMEDAARSNQVALNTAAAKSMGGNADQTGQLSDKVFADTKDKLGLVFDRISGLGKVMHGGRSVNPIQLDSGVIAAADDVIRKQMKLGSRGNPTILNLARDAKRDAGLRTRIDGEAYKLWHSNLTDASYTAYSAGDSVAGDAYKKLMTALDNAADKSLRKLSLGSLADDLKAVRPLYANFKTLTKGATVEAGNVNPAKVASVLRQANPDAFRTGKGGDLANIGRYAEAFKPLRPGSQTFERQMISDPLSTLAYMGPGYAIAKIATSPAATLIPRKLGGTTAGAILGPASNYATRENILAVLKRLTRPQTP